MVFFYYYVTYSSYSAGAGICRGPSNMIGNGYMALPIAITVEGANILTRSMITFGQGDKYHILYPAGYVIYYIPQGMSVIVSC